MKKQLGLVVSTLMNKKVKVSCSQLGLWHSQQIETWNMFQSTNMHQPNKSSLNNMENLVWTMALGNIIPKASKYRFFPASYGWLPEGLLCLKPESGNGELWNKKLSLEEIGMILDDFGWFACQILERFGASAWPMRSKYGPPMRVVPACVPKTVVILSGFPS